MHRVHIVKGVHRVIKVLKRVHRVIQFNQKA